MFWNWFFCLIRFPNTSYLLPSLITCCHILDEKNISNKKIYFSLNNGESHFEILVDDSRMTYSSEKFDITIIQIKENDGLDISSFLEIDHDIFENDLDNAFIDKSIYIINYREQVQYSLGIKI